VRGSSGAKRTRVPNASITSPIATTQRTIANGVPKLPCTVLRATVASRSAPTIAPVKARAMPIEIGKRTHHGRFSSYS
jgi:hypothetical protein